VGVFMRMNLQALPKRPQTDTDQKHANEAIAPTGYEINRQNSSQHERQDAYDRNPRRVSGTPAQSGHPGAPPPLHRQRSNGRKVIWAGKDVEEASNDSANDDKHVRCRNRDYPNPSLLKCERSRPIAIQ
jgi:hypothetical protein